MATIELARFTVDPADVDDMLRSRRAMVAAVAELPGFTDIDLVRIDEHTWLDTVRWASRADADAAAAKVQDIPACAAMFRFIREVVSMEHGEIATTVA